MTKCYLCHYLEEDAASILLAYIHQQISTSTGSYRGRWAIPLGQITLPVTFRTPTNYRTKFIKFEVANFDSSYHAIFGCPALAKFMAVPHYPYLLIKMSGPNCVLSLRGDLKHSYGCDTEAVQIATKAQLALEV
jgi:hypothetical protein